jgi:hypothetical protein
MGFVEQRVVAVADGYFQQSFADVVVQWGTGMA